MTVEEFNNKYIKMASTVENRLVIKADQYSNSKDRYIQFKYFCSIVKCTIYQAIWFQLSKHLARLGLILDEKRQLSEGEADELFGDIISYFYLIWGLYKYE